MSQPLLSILIPTTPERQVEFDRLLDRLEILSAGYSVKIISDDTGKQMTIGEKRERLYKAANGLYSLQIDDDDDIADNAIELIIGAIKSNPGVDVISFEEYCNMDGKEYKSNHSNDYLDWEGDGSFEFPDGFHFHRTIFYKDVIKTELAKSVPFVYCRFGEDHLFAKDLKPHIKSEFHIAEQLYRYIHVSSDFNERYGLNSI
mgnify:CR=1 FL=1|jgi:hypothetical protein